VILLGCEYDLNININQRLPVLLPPFPVTSTRANPIAIPASVARLIITVAFLLSYPSTAFPARLEPTVPSSEWTRSCDVTTSILLYRVGHLERPMAATETQLTRLLLSTNAAPQSPRNPTFERTATLEVDEDGHVVEHGAVEVFHGDSRRCLVDELNEGVSLRRASDDVSHDSHTTDAATLGAQAPQTVNHTTQHTRVIITLVRNMYASNPQ